MEKKSSKEMYTGKEILNSKNKKYKVFLNHKLVYNSKKLYQNIKDLLTTQAH